MRYTLSIAVLLSALAHASNHLPTENDAHQPLSFDNSSISRPSPNIDQYDDCVRQFLHVEHLDTPGYQALTANCKM